MLKRVDDELSVGASLYQIRTGCHGAAGLSPVTMGTALHFDTSGALGTPALTWTLVGRLLDTMAVKVNGRASRLRPKEIGIELAGTPVSGVASLPGQWIVFVAAPGARNLSCR